VISIIFARHSTNYQKGAVLSALSSKWGGGCDGKSRCSNRRRIRNRLYAYRNPNCPQGDGHHLQRETASVLLPGVQPSRNLDRRPCLTCKHRSAGSQDSFFHLCHQHESKRTDKAATQVRLRGVASSGFTVAPGCYQGGSNFCASDAGRCAGSLKLTVGTQHRALTRVALPQSHLSSRCRATPQESAPMTQPTSFTVSGSGAPEARVHSSSSLKPSTENVVVKSGCAKPPVVSRGLHKILEPNDLAVFASHFQIPLFTYPVINSRTRRLCCLI